MRQILYTILTLFVLTGTAASWQAAGQVREDRMYRIVSPSGLAIDNRLNPDNLGNLFLSPVDRKDKGQLWRLVKYADAYVIYSPFTNKSFDVVNAGGEDTPLGTWDFSRANVNQHFVVTFNADGTIAINHQNSGRGLALTGEDRDGEKVFHFGDESFFRTSIDSERYSYQIPIEEAANCILYILEREGRILTKSALRRLFQKELGYEKLGSQIDRLFEQAARSPRIKRTGNGRFTI